MLKSKNGLNRKSWLAILLSIALTLTLALPSFNETLPATICNIPQGFIGIYNFGDLNNIRNAPYRDYALCDNIDLTLNGSFFPIPTFGGSLEGNNFTLSGLSLIRPDLESGQLNSDNLGLFGEITARTPNFIRNLKLSNFTVSGGNMVGLIAANLTGQQATAMTEVSGISIANSNVISNADAGLLFGHIKFATLSDIDVQSSTIKGVSKIGGIVGSAESSLIERTTFHTPNHWGVWGAAAVGGLVGYGLETTLQASTYHSSSIQFDPTISGLQDERAVGGLFGVMKDSKALDSWVLTAINSQQTIRAEPWIGGGIAGHMTGNTNRSQKTSIVAGCRFDGSLSGTFQSNASNGYIGGIVGLIGEKTYLTNNISLGSCNSGQASNVGAIYGARENGVNSISAHVTTQNLSLTPVSCPPNPDCPIVPWADLSDLDTYTDWRDSSSEPAVTFAGDGTCSQWELTLDVDGLGAPAPGAVAHTEPLCPGYIAPSPTPTPTSTPPPTTPTVAPTATTTPSSGQTPSASPTPNPTETPNGIAGGPTPVSIFSYIPSAPKVKWGQRKSRAIVSMQDLSGALIHHLLIKNPRNKIAIKQVNGTTYRTRKFSLSGKYVFRYRISTADGISRYSPATKLRR